MRNHTQISVLTALLLTLAALLPFAVKAAPARIGLAQAEDPASPANRCADVRYLIDREITPFELNIGGGVLQSGEPVNSALDGDDYLDVWAFSGSLPRNAVGTALLDTLTFNITLDRGSPPLEVALFLGMEPITDEVERAVYHRVETARTLTYTLDRDAIWTVVVRRTTLANETPSNYELTATFNSDGPVTVDDLRNETSAITLEPAPSLRGGHELIPINDARVRTHVGSAIAVASRDGEAAQVFFSASSSVLVNNWADSINLLGGDLSANGAAGNRPRRFFLRDYGYRANLLDGDLLSFTDANNTTWSISWDVIDGIWIMDSCAGFKLQDGRSFVGTLDPEQRAVIFSGTYDDFTLSLETPTTSGDPGLHTIEMNWAGIVPRAQVTLYDGVLAADLIGERALRLQSSSIVMQRSAPPSGVPPENAVLSIDLLDRQAQIVLDWVNLGSFTLVDDDLTLDFIDGVRGTITRPGANLSIFDAREDVIRIRYKDGASQSPGEERLLLPAEESFIEIVTPQGLPAHDGRALPGEMGYAPRGLNNTGGECYPINTMLPQANCPPSGHFNPANGNLWYAVTDLIAFGGGLDLALARSYNSALANVDGPFGPGWTTGFRLDYAVSFDPATGSRLVTPAEAARYPVGLDLSWTPRGIVTLHTFSGSSHTFISQEPIFTSGTLTALTMPGWTLTRADIRSPWVLRQDNGRVYEFDRAGRLSRYGAPSTGRMIEIDYPGTDLNGAVDRVGEGPVRITDAADQRQLELTYDDAGRIARAVLRDTTAGSTDATCEPGNPRCMAVSYSYDDGLLSEVIYPDGSSATYKYDEAGRLIYHDDPRAPISPVMSYSYDEDGSAEASITVADAEASTDVTIWQSLLAPTINNNTLNRTVIDAEGRSRTFTYDYTSGERKSVGESFTLLRETSPLDGLSRFESEPITYTWEDGLLTSKPRRITSDNVGRNTVTFEYASGANLTRIRGGYPNVSIEYTAVEGTPLGATAGSTETDAAGGSSQNGDSLLAAANPILPALMTFPDGTTEQFTYDARGLLIERVDRLGEVYRYTWDDRRRLATVESVNEGVISAYTYNALGLTASVARYRSIDAPTTATTTSYTYDAFGRLTGVDDSLTGGYSVQYVIGESQTTISMTDATATTTDSVYDARGFLIKQTITAADGAVLRQAHYGYDRRGRILEERHLLTRFDPAEDAPTDGEHTDTELVTRYDYAAIETLSPLPGQDEPVEVRGYAVRMTDPYGRVTETVYDGRDRLRQVTDLLGHVTRYDYAPDDAPSDNPNGLLITETRVIDDRLVGTRTYVFDLEWQLREVLNGTFTWEIVPFFRTNRPEILQARQTGLASVVWSEYVGGRPSGAAITPLVPPSPAGVEPFTAEISAEYDHYGRPLRVTDAAGVVRRVVYCPEPGGALRTVYGLAQDDSLDCMRRDYARALTHDAHGRLVHVDEPIGTREYSYTADADNGTWQVEVSFDDDTTWHLTYNGLGELIAWRDADGFRRSYAYDTLGSLRRVETPGIPEASFTYDYNAAGLVVAEVDDLGRGARYDYDPLGRLIVRQDIRSASATIYGYNDTGYLESIISPLGNTTTYLYEDPVDPARLTGIIEPTGATYSFAWDETVNALRFTDPRGNTTAYSFDGLGELRRIDDALGRVHEVLYNPAGALTGWRQSQAEDSPAAVRIDVQRPQVDHIVVRTPGLDWERAFDRLPDGRLEGVGADQPGVGLTFAYDALGRLTQASSGGLTWSLAYGSNPPAITITEPDGSIRAVRYDALNRLAADTRDEAAVTYTYNQGRAADQEIIIEEPDGVRRTVIISPGDATSRPPTVQVETSGGMVTYTYTVDGLLSEITTAYCVDFATLQQGGSAPTQACFRENPEQVWRTTERIIYDTLGRPVRAVDREQNIETFAYDDAGNLVVYQDVSGRTYDYSYDAFNRLAALTGPTGIRLLFDYDDADQVRGICQARAETADTYAACAEDPTRVIETYTSDLLGRLTSRTVPLPDTDPALMETFSYTVGGSGSMTAWGTDAQRSVELSYDSVGLGLPVAVTIDGDRLPLEIDAFSEGLRTARQTEAQYSYDPFGHLDLLRIPTTRIRQAYRYADGDRGYTVTDDATGAQLSFGLDLRRMLTAVSTVSAAGDENGVVLDYFLNPDGRILVADLVRSDDQLVQYQLNRRGETRNIAYIDSNLLVDYTLDAAGQVQRESVIGAPDFFSARAGDYIIVIGYDSDGRPLTMRINDRASGELLYLLSMTYDDSGRRTTETRQFGDGTRISISYTHDAADRLTTRTVSTNRPAGSGALSLTGLIILLGLAWGIRPGVRRLALATLFSGLIIGVMLTFSTAQQAPGSYTQTYTYDDAGSIAEIRANDTLCRSFEYDSAGRLLTVYGANGAPLRQYDYDLYGRLVAMDDLRLTYQGSSDALLAVYDGETPRFHAQTGDQPPLYQAEAGFITWMLQDGRDSVLAVTRNNETTRPVWLFDPLGRYLMLQAPATDDPCALPQTPPELMALAPLQIFQPGMIWDPLTGLYFDDMRAYLPEIGQYLQRDWLGPDASGTVYGFPSRQIQPPTQASEPGYTEVLHRLNAALATIHQGDAPTAASGWERHQPHPADPVAEPLLDQLDTIQAGARARSRQLLDLPLWLTRNYNLPAAYRDAANALRLPPDNAPGQGGRGTDLIETDVTSNFDAHWLPHIAPPGQRLGTLYALTTPQIGIPRLYLPDDWRPALPALGATLGDVMRPDVASVAQPADIWAWIPQALDTPMHASTALAAVEILTELPARSTADWLYAMLAAALPDAPRLPPVDAAAYLRAWFPGEAPPITADLRARWPTLPPVNLPVFDLGINP